MRRVVLAMALLAGCAPGWARDWVTESGGTPWSIASAPGGWRFEIRPGDVAPWDAAHHHPAERAEVSGWRDKAPVEKDIVFAMTLTVEPGPPVTAR